MLQGLVRISRRRRRRRRDNGGRDCIVQTIGSDAEFLQIGKNRHDIMKGRPMVVSSQQIPRHIQFGNGMSDGTAVGGGVVVVVIVTRVDGGGRPRCCPLQ